MGKINAICISEKRGTVKTTVSSAVLITDFGIENDAHAGKWHRQVSLLSYKDIESFNKLGGNVKDGEFGENLIISGIDFDKLNIGTKLKTGDAILEITQRGKECHNDCEIKKRVGHCIMPVKGIFAKVINGGIIKPDDEIYII